MSVTAADFHEFAVRIAEAGKEIDFRNAISRTYYAAFHACLPRFASGSDGVDPRIGHAAFTGWLQNHAASTPIRRLGVHLNLLRQQRNAADYTLRRDFKRFDVETAFGVYGNVMRLLEQAAPSSETSI
jgi:hypothetical protein